MGAAPQHDRNRSYLPSAAAARAACDMLRPATSDMARMPAARCTVWIQSLRGESGAADAACNLPAASLDWGCCPSPAALAVQHLIC